MKKINFYFSTKLTFDDYVHEHSFALRVIPPETPTQHIVSCELSISPITAVDQSTDAFGNNVTAGYIKGDHRFLDFEIKGTAETDCTRHRTDYMPCYLYQSAFTKPSAALASFLETLSDDLSEESVSERVQTISSKLSDVFRYQKDVTTSHTTAAEAFETSAGVCQDFSHIMLSLLRLNHIPCRYIAGLAFCDGETHSWIEYFEDGVWKGFDPANDRPVNEDYLVLSQGRDFADCAIDRGVMFGSYTRQLTLVRSVMQQGY
ncbi:MAG: transglutaminase family protein [Ruminiclostridium sp.]|nr:transglutaminase family protein [Ruminiclostridium sp.]